MFLHDERVAAGFALAGLGIGSAVRFGSRLRRYSSSGGTPLWCPVLTHDDLDRAGRHGRAPAQRPGHGAGLLAFDDQFAQLVVRRVAGDRHRVVHAARQQRVTGEAAVRDDLQLGDRDVALAGRPQDVVEQAAATARCSR